MKNKLIIIFIILAQLSFSKAEEDSNYETWTKINKSKESLSGEITGVNKEIKDVKKGEIFEANLKIWPANTKLINNLKDKIYLPFLDYYYLIDVGNAKSRNRNNDVVDISLKLVKMKHTSTWDQSILKIADIIISVNHVKAQVAKDETLKPYFYFTKWHKKNLYERFLITILAIVFIIFTIYCLKKIKKYTEYYFIKKNKENYLEMLIDASEHKNDFNLVLKNKTYFEGIGNQKLKSKLIHLEKHVLNKKWVKPDFNNKMESENDNDN